MLAALLIATKLSCRFFFGFCLSASFFLWIFLGSLFAARVCSSSLARQLVTAAQEGDGNGDGVSGRKY